MSSTTSPSKTALPSGLDPRVLARILEEGYGPGAWHGPDLKTALADVSPAVAFWRPAPGRHSIAEVAIHHAYYQHSVRGRLGAPAPEPFVLEGDDWFALEDASPLTWPRIVSIVEDQQRLLVETVRRIADGAQTETASESDRFELVLGITCHAVYHAGQIQLLKKLAEGANLRAR